MRAPSNQELYETVLLNKKNFARAQLLICDGAPQEKSTIKRIRLKEYPTSITAEDYQKRLASVGPWVNEFLNSTRPIPTLSILPPAANTSLLERLIMSLWGTSPEDFNCCAHIKDNTVEMVSRPDYDPNTILAHEITHTRQVNISEDYRAFLEGHAIGVERHYITTQNDPSLELQYAIFRNLPLSEFLKRESKVARERIDALHTNYDSDDFVTMSARLSMHSNAYQIGDAAFRVAESKYGTDIYKDTLREPMLLIDVLRDV